jgi:hypothetical protein
VTGNACHAKASAASSKDRVREDRGSRAGGAEE